MTDNTLDTIRKLNPMPDPAVDPQVKAELATRIANSPSEPAAAMRATRPRVRRHLVPVLMAAGLVAGAAVTLGLPDDDTPRALSFTQQGDFLIVKIVDPHADSERYNKEFRERGLNIKLRLLPVSPSGVGINIGQGYDGPESESIATSEDPPGCVENGSYPCVPTFKVPVDYKGTADLYIGRAAGPDEDYASGGEIDARGEVLNGVRWKNRPVREVVAILKSRGHQVTRYYIGQQPAMDKEAKTVPDTWRVVDGTAWKRGQVMLWVRPGPR